jgi:esterase/lipase
MKMAFNNPAGYVINPTLAIAALLSLFYPFLSASAATVEVKLPTGIIASANFHSGLQSRPAVLLLHGFLQTYHSPPMSSLASNLASKGYTVLSPTISLGINLRNQSMACEAVHTHTIAEDVAEVAYWVNWLGKKGYKNIVIAGFSSSGNLQTLLLNAQGLHPSVKKAILVSLTPTLSDATERQKARSESGAKVQAGKKEIGTYSLGYCKKNYVATTGSYLSYAQLDESRVLELVRQTPVPTEIILGSADTILPANWQSQIKALQTKNRVTVIERANHFFDATNEFDLAEEVENILKNLPPYN